MGQKDYSLFIFLFLKKFKNNSGQIAYAATAPCHVAKDYLGTSPGWQKKKLQVCTHQRICTSPMQLKGSYTFSTSIHNFHTAKKNFAHHTLTHIKKGKYTTPHKQKTKRHSKMDTHAKIVHNIYVQLCLVSTAKTTPLCRHVAPQAAL